jgi:hypothetical protein
LCIVLLPFFAFTKYNFFLFFLIITIVMIYFIFYVYWVSLPSCFFSLSSHVILTFSLFTLFKDIFSTSLYQS